MKDGGYINSGFHAGISQLYVNATIRIVDAAFIVVTRSDFQNPDVISNLGSIGLRIRESFDLKRRPCKPWSQQSYLATHKRLLRQVQDSEEEVSSSLFTGNV